MPASPASTSVCRRPGGPYFDDLAVGQRISSVGLRLTDGMSAVHQSILGDRAPLALDPRLAMAITGAQTQLAHSGLVWDVAIGQSTFFSQRAKANLFYRGLLLHRIPEIGDTLYTDTEVVGLRENARREGRFPTGMMALRIKTVDQCGRTVLDFSRCAMIPMSSEDVSTGHAQDLSTIPANLDVSRLKELTSGWDLRAHPPCESVATGDVLDGGADVVTSAPELARLTLNLAAVHHDYRATGDKRRLVYGGHTIGLAAAQLSKAIPQLVCVVGWNSCDHIGPVHEGDTVVSTIEVEKVELLDNGGQLVDLRSKVYTVHPDGKGDDQVLDWRVVGVLA
ncbi:MaoC family dehydratase [Rhodococcus baikonurensis]|uniref:MaoC family dehydratase n=2 Tax=Rhodococcus TaxID=1827 RepID=A0ABV5XMK2_9NOCA